MTCGKCGKQIDDGDVKCKFCGADTQNKEKFVVKIESQEYLSIKDADVAYDKQKTSSAEVQDEQQDKSEDLSRERTHDEGKYSEKVIRRSQTSSHHAAGHNQMQRHVQPASRHSAGSKLAADKKRKKDKPTAREKKPLAAIKIISVVCAVVLVCLSVVSIKTDIFKSETGSKPVALIKLSKSQTEAFEEFVPGFTSLFDMGYDSTKSVLDDVISLFEPTNPGGLYCSVNDAAAVSAESDPLGRYTDCCTVSPESVADVAGKLGLTSYNDIDCASCYFYDGKYYFKKADTDTQNKVVDVTDSRKLSDGGYYVTADIYPAGTQADEKGEYSVQAEKTLYFELALAGTQQAETTSAGAAQSETASAQTTQETEDGSDEDNTEFVLKKISATALYGTQAENEEDNKGSLNYTVKRTVIEAKCSDGKIYARYVVECPYFNDETTETASIINSIYSAVAADFGANTDAEKVDKQYKSFINKGGSDSSLPIYTNVSVSVKYNADGFISFLERRTSYTGLEKITAVNEAKKEFERRYGYEPESVEEQDKIYLPETTYEGYTYRISDGEFIKKDEFLGKDYLDVQTDLYNAYITQYGKSGEEVDTDSYSDENSEIGKAIYESAWTIGENNVTFYYKNSDGMVMPVTLSRGEIQSGEELTAQSTEDNSESEPEDVTQEQ